MKILIIQPTGDKRGHYGLNTTKLCQELTERRNEVVLVTNKLYPEKFLKEKPIFKYVEVKGGKYNFENFDKKKKNNFLFYLWGYLRNSFLILRAGIRLAKKYHFDIIQILDTEYGILGIMLKIYGKKLPPVALLINAPNFSFKKYSGIFPLRLYKELQKRFLIKAINCPIAGIVTIGKYHQENLISQLKLPNNFPISIIYDGTSPADFLLSKKRARKKFAINYSGPIFLFFGMLRKDKGLEFFLKAASIIKKDFKIFIAGSLFDYQEKDIKILIKKNKLEKKIILKLDYIENNDIPFLFYSADALILPYLKNYTGGSGPLVREAAIYKLPVIVSDVSEMGGLVKKYKIGLTAQPENAIDLAKNMNKFLELSEKKREIMSKNIAKIASTWKKNAQLYENFYNEIINGLD